MSPHHPPELKRAQWLAKVLDSAIEIPWIKVRIGLDPVLGLMPGVGDGLGTLLALYPVYVALQWGAGKEVLIQMLANVALDLVAGFVPVVGDFIDVSFKANLRNVALLEKAWETLNNTGIIDVTPE